MPTATTNIEFVLHCTDHSIANSTPSICADGSLPLQLSTEELACTDGNHPHPNGICADGSLALLLNETQTAVTGQLPPPETTGEMLENMTSPG